MRRLVTVLTALLLATAAAVGAGDDVKCSTSTTAAYPRLEAEPRALNYDYEKTFGKYNITWAPPFGWAAVYSVSALYYGWEVRCAALNHAVKAGNLPPEKVGGKLAEAKQVYDGFALFYVNVDLKDKSSDDLSDAEKWEIYLDDGSVIYKPVLIQKVPHAFDGLVMVINDKPPVAVTDFFGLNNHKIVFARPYSDTPPPYLRLVIRSDKVTRGFEWRFVEE